MRISSTIVSALIVIAGLTGASAPAAAQETIKIGEINSYSALPLSPSPIAKVGSLRSRRSTPPAASAARNSK